MTITTDTLLKKILLVILAVAAVYFAKDFLMPLAIAGVLATLFLPISRWLEKKIPRALAAFICLLLFVTFLSGIIFLLSWQVSELPNDLTLVKEKISNAGKEIGNFIFKHVGISASKQSQILKEEQPPVSDILQTITGSVAGILMNFILIMAYLVLLLIYRNHIRRFIFMRVTASRKKEMQVIVTGVANVSQQYMVGLAKMIGCLWIMYGIGFSILGVKSALFFAVLCGILEIIPFVGNLTGTTITLLVSAAAGASTGTLVGIVIVYGVVQLIQGWVLEPLILGPQVRLNPFATVLVLVLGELLWGLPGVFLAIPVTAMFKIVCDHVTFLKPYGFLLGKTNARTETD